MIGGYIVKRSYPCAIVFFGVFCFSNSLHAVDITISVPVQGSLVDQRQDISGSVSDPAANVFVVVHPVTVSEFWIQPPVTVRNSGEWKVKAHFGRQGMDQGAEFEIRAFANPSAQLQEGKYSTWPAAAARSDVVEVKRK